MTSATDPFDHLFWLASRSAGVLAWLALSASMVIGLSMATKVAPRSMTPRLRTVTLGFRIGFRLGVSKSEYSKKLNLRTL